MERMDGRTDATDRRARADADGRREGGAAGRTSDAFSRADGRAKQRERGGDDGQRRRGAGLTCEGQKTGAANRRRRREATLEIDYRMKLGRSRMNPVQSDGRTAL